MKSVGIYRDGVIAPMLHFAGVPIPYVAPGWDAQGKAMPEMALQRGARQVHAVEAVEAVDEIAEPCIYGGFLDPHYGHFLVEGLARYWAIRSPRRRIVWHAARRRLASWQREIFSLLGLPVSEADIVTRPTRFRDLLVPTPGAILWSSYHPFQAEALGVYPFGGVPKTKRLWLSRSGLRDDRAAIVGEGELEALLRADGWEIMHPEQHSVPEQLRQMSEASVIGGFDGSAFHTLLLADKVDAKILIVPRGTAHGIPNTYLTIAKAKSLDQHLVGTELVLDENRRRKSVTRMSSPEELFAAMQKWHEN